ncbi:hypothetical protein D3C77_558790 [compost metagenome]
MPRRVDRIQRALAQAIRRQQPAQPPLLDRLAGGVERQQANAHAQLAGHQHGVGDVGGKTVVRCDHALVHPLREHPVTFVHRISHAQATVLVQVFRALWHAVGHQVARRRAGDAENVAQRHGDQLRIRQRPVHGNHHVMPFGQRVGVALGQGQLDHHLRAQRVVAGHQRHQQQAQPVRAMQAQAATGREMRATGFAHRFFGQ